jgi:hypothetical protein
MKLRLTKRRKQWWISTDEDEFGPYDNKREAEEDLHGLERFYRVEIHRPREEDRKRL